MKNWMIGITLAFSLMGCSAFLSNQPQNSPAAGDQTGQENNVAAPSKISADLKDYGPAPELTNEVWLNTEGPLRLADLRGKVVLLDMWTFG